MCRRKHRTADNRASPSARHEERDGTRTAHVTKPHLIRMTLGQLCAVSRVAVGCDTAWNRTGLMAVPVHSPQLMAQHHREEGPLNLAIWDTAGQERFHALGPIYYRDSNGAILVYDITDEDSFQKVKNWVKELRKMLGNEICLCIVGNKVDLEKERHVSVEEAEGYAESVGAKHYHTSAKLNKGIEELFLDLCKRMMETAQAEERAKGNGASQSTTSRRGVQIVDDDPQAATAAGGCCSSA
uniref:ras-related protein Rab-21-like n=1 Tax=Oncorhynchus gorbuscha TaxID=8017 RepID=UPI001EAF8A67|nr:ras-related protein Rab-21-like [Oncorhynchus gorbuscha]